MTEETLSIGDLTIAVRREATDLPSATDGPLALFTTPTRPTTPTATVSVVWWDDRRSPVRRTEQLFASGGTWTLYRSADGGYVYDISSPVFGAQPYRTAWFDASYQTGWIAYRPDAVVRRAMRAALEYPLDELLVTNLLARGRGAELHACAVRDVDGRGFLFVGQSGDGKTTTARLWAAAGATILSDDRVIVRRIHGQWRMFGTPWHGEADYACPDSAVITGVFVLRRGRENVIEPVSSGLLSALLFARAFPPFYDPEAMDFTAGFLAELATSVPGGWLAFTPTMEVVDFIRRWTP
ncbi:MAG: hypothetical protein NZ585_08000 [Chloracidobacterium sp.]|nr:hypothetical protein [Chloracidobacterium sp.]MDW8218047.1 hypothetical protein [Acidobacteriota bacterium]